LTTEEVRRVLEQMRGTARLVPFQLFAPSQRKPVLAGGRRTTLSPLLPNQVGTALGALSAPRIRGAAGEGRGCAAERDHQACDVSHAVALNCDPSTGARGGYWDGAGAAGASRRCEDHAVHACAEPGWPGRPEPSRPGRTWGSCWGAWRMRPPRRSVYGDGGPAGERVGRSNTG